MRKNNGEVVEKVKEKNKRRRRKKKNVHCNLKFIEYTRKNNIQFFSCSCCK